MNGNLVVILTALNLEYEAVRRHLTDLRLYRHSGGTRFEVGRIGNTDCQVALALTGKGNHPTAVLAERAIQEFSPAAVFFVGVAGGLWPSIRLGDVVVATKIYAYHGGTSEDDGLKARPKAWEISHEADQIAHYVARRAEWNHGLSVEHPPTVHFGPIAAGEVVQDSAVSDQAQWIRQHYNDALAIEMEAAGAAQAGHHNHGLPVVVVRGISDHADGSKTTTDGQNWQPRAAAHAAAFATALAQELITESAVDEPRATGASRSQVMGMTNYNIAAANARVGVQAGEIHGNVIVSSEPDRPVDLAASLAELRDRLKQAHRDGQLDEETYAAAESELDTADKCLQENPAGSRNALMVTLKRLRGLVADVTELAARLAMIIAMVKEMS